MLERPRPVSDAELPAQLVAYAEIYARTIAQHSFEWQNPKTGEHFPSIVAVRLSQRKDKLEKFSDVAIVESGDLLQFLREGGTIAWWYGYKKIVSASLQIRKLSQWTNRVNVKHYTVPVARYVGGVNAQQGIKMADGNTLNLTRPNIIVGWSLGGSPKDPRDRLAEFRANHRENFKLYTLENYLVPASRLDLEQPFSVQNW